MSVILATVSNNPGFHNDVRAALDNRFRFEAAWDLSYEDAPRLRGVGADQQCLAVLDFSDPARALPGARLANGRPQLMAVAVNCGSSREELLGLMQAGVRDVLPQLTGTDLRAAADRALANLAAAGERTADLYAFLPAKPGCGATTLATQACGMAARLQPDPLLLVDSDIRLGVTSFLLKASSTCNIVDALEYADRLDWDLWSGMISQMGNFHLLGSGAVDISRRFAVEQLTKMLDYAVRQYSVIGIDLPGVMEDFESEVLMRAKRVYLVTTPDVSALHVARRKSAWLQDMKLAANVSVVLNCVERRSTLAVADIERVIELPVRHILPVAAQEISRAVQKGALVDSGSALGKQISKIAAELAQTGGVPVKRNPVRRFVEYFSISSARQFQARQG